MSMFSQRRQCLRFKLSMLERSSWSVKRNSNTAKIVSMTFFQVILCSKLLNTWLFHYSTTQLELSECLHGRWYKQTPNLHSCRLIEIMKIYLAVLLVAVFSAWSASACKDASSCSLLTTNSCFGEELQECPKLCQDCDGSKYKKYKAIFNDKSKCEDAYANICKKWYVGEMGCTSDKAKNGCRKSCKACKS